MTRDLELALKIKAATEGLDQVKRVVSDIGRLGGEARKSARDTGTLSRALDGGRDAAKRFGSGLKSLHSTIFSLKGLLAGLGAGLVARSFIDAASTAEQYQVRLKVLLGSVEEGNRLFREMADYAGRVPFQFEEIMGAATQLAGVLDGGVDEIKQYMPLIGDLAAASGLSIQQTTEQVIRMFSAGAASADLFRERGILAMLGFQAGVTYSAEETKQRLIEAWEEPGSRFRGATEELATTWTGLLSMMSDKWFQFRNLVMDSAPFDYLKAVLDLILDRFGASADEIDRTARSIGEGIVDLAKRFALGAASVIDAVAPPLRVVKELFNGFINTWNSLPAWVQEIGIAGALFGGKKGRWAVVGITAFLGAAKKFDDWLAEHVPLLAKRAAIFDDTGEKSLIGLITGGQEHNESAVASVKALLDELDARVAESRAKAAAGGASGAGAPPRPQRPAGGAAKSDPGADAIAGIERQIALLGVETEHERVLWEVQQGRYRDLSHAQQQALLDAARRLDIAQDEMRAEEERVRAAEAARQALRRIIDEVDPTAPLLRELELIERLREAWPRYADVLDEAALRIHERIDEINNGAEKSEKSFGIMTEFAVQAARNIQSGFANLLYKPWEKGLAGMLSSWADFLHQMAAQLLAQTALKQFFGWMSGLGGGLGDFGSAVLANIKHGGGMVGTGPTRSVPALAYLAAPRYHSSGVAGLAPDEVPAVLRRGEEVLTPDDPRHRYNGGGQNITNEVGIRINNILDPKLLGDYLTSSEGERILNNYITRNTYGIKMILGV